jgi:hypothetical protein
MYKDLIIGAISNYTWNDIKCWLNSITMSGFDGDVVLVGTNINKDTIDKLTERGVRLELYGKKTEDGGVVSTDSSMPPHVERFFYIWNYLNKNTGYRYVITTDTRDVIFQKNPVEYLAAGLTIREIIFSSEGIRYANEPWGSKNYHQTFGPYFFDQIKYRLIYNVGVIAGLQPIMTSLMAQIFHMSMNRPIKICDQAVFNMLITHYPYNMGRHSENDEGWAIQLGTTKEAVKSGSGDIGQIFSKNPMQYDMIYEDKQPIIDPHGQVLTADGGTLYTIVHQYDRIPELNDKILKMYGDDNVTKSRVTFHHPV